MIETTTVTTSAAYNLLSGLVLDDTGRRWGEVATEWQRDDALALVADLVPDGPRRFNFLRGRGMSKTTDVAGCALALLLTSAPSRSRSYVYAVDGDQASIFADALVGFVTRTPGLSGAVEVRARTLTVRANGATLTVETSDGASALGTRPWLTVCDELGAWPDTANHQRLWSAVVSAVPKVPGSRLVVIGTAGSPTGIGARVWEGALNSAMWHTSKRPGPSPWWSPEDVAATSSALTASEYRRLVLCEWAEGDDSLTSPEVVAAVIRTGVTDLPPRRGVRYVAALDVGTRRDLTALVIAHAEQREAGRVIVIDKVVCWRPEKGAGAGNADDPLAGRVDLTEVEETTLRVCREYGVTNLKFDRMQAEQLSTNLARAGIPTSEYVFSSAGANKLARTLWTALRDRSIELPDDEETRHEFTTARLIQTGPGTVKLQNPIGSHDDIVVAVGMALVDLLDGPDVGRGRISVPKGRITRTMKPKNLVTASQRAVLDAQRTGPKGIPAIVGVKGTITPGRNAHDRPGVVATSRAHLISRTAGR